MRDQDLPKQLKLYWITALVITIFTVLPIRISAQSSNLPQGVTAVAWSPDGSRIAIAGDPSSTVNQVLIFDVQSGQVVQQLDVYTVQFPSPGANPEIVSGDESVVALDWSPDGTRIAAGTIGSILTQIWDVQTGQLVLTYPLNLGGGQSGAGEVQWSPDGTQLAIASPVAATVINSTTGETVTRFYHGAISIAWNPEGTKLVSGEDNIAWVWDAETGEELLSLEGNTALSALDLSPDGTKIASGDTIDDSVRIWDASTGDLLLLINEQNEYINDVTWYSDNTQLAVGTNDGTIHIWDTTNGELVHALETGRQVYEVEWSPDGTQLTYAGGSLEPGDNPIPILEFPTANAGGDQMVTASNGTSAEVALDGSDSLPLYVDR